MEAPPRTGKPKDGRTLDAGGCRPSAAAQVSGGAIMVEVILCTTCFLSDRRARLADHPGGR